MTGLSTTNIMLGIIAATGVLELIAIAVVCSLIGVLCWRLMQFVARMEKQHIEPTAARVQAILDDVGTVTSTVRTRTMRTDAFIMRLLRLWERFGPARGGDK